VTSSASIFIVIISLSGIIISATRRLVIIKAFSRGGGFVKTVKLLGFQGGGQEADRDKKS
jgi:hypothetical protein